MPTLLRILGVALHDVLLTSDEYGAMSSALQTSKAPQLLPRCLRVGLMNTGQFGASG